jgi:transposase
MNQLRVAETKERLWRNRIRRQQQSGLSIRAFCAEESLSEASFHWWRRELARRKAPSRARPSTVRQQASVALPEVAKFVPVTVAPSSPCPSIEIVLGGGVLVRVLQDCSSQLLRKVLAALETSRC